MNKAKEISALWKQIKPQIGELARLCHEVESHYEVTADAYQRGHENGFIAGHLKAEKSGQSFCEDGYQRGLNDAWECARKICLEDDDGGIPASVINDIFSVCNYRNALMDFSVSEAIEKIRQYEQEKGKIQVGDEVVIRNKTAVVTEITDRYVRIMYSDGSCYALFSKGIAKTGRHFPEIVAVLEKMRGEQDG